MSSPSQSFTGQYEVKAESLYDLSNGQNISGGSVCMASDPSGWHLVVAMTSNSRVITLDTAPSSLSSETTVLSSVTLPEALPGPLAFDPSDGALAMFVNNELTRWHTHDGKLVQAKEEQPVKIPLRKAKGLQVSNMTFDARGRLLVDGEPNCWVHDGKVEPLTGPPQVDMGDGEMAGPDVANDALFALPDGKVLLQNNESLQLFLLDGEGKVDDISPNEEQGGIPMNSQICVSPGGHIVCVGMVYNSDDDLPTVQVTVLRRGHAPVVTRLMGLPEFEEIEVVSVDAQGLLYMCLVLEWPGVRAIFRAIPAPPCSLQESAITSIIEE